MERVYINRRLENGTKYYQSTNITIPVCLFVCDFDMEENHQHGMARQDLNLLVERIQGIGDIAERRYGMYHQLEEYSNAPKFILVFLY